jgi:hypothetical protein
LSWITSKLAGTSSRAWALLAVAAVALLGAAGGGGYFLYLDSVPTKTTFNVKDNQREVPLTQRITVTFSRPVALESMVSGLKVTPATDGKLTASKDLRSYTFEPTEPMKDLTQYTIQVAPPRATGAREVTPARLRFTTTLVPRVTALTTEVGAAVASNGEVPLNASLKLVFNAAMDASSVKVLLNTKPIDLTWAADGKSAGMKTQGLGVGPLDLAIAPGGRDLTNHPLSTDWNFHGTLVFSVSLHTVPLKYPALVQIPNDDYGARDQSGLQAADMVWEYETEGGITRLTAVFTRAADNVGPIRSGRLISFRLTRMYHGLLFFSGLSPGSFAALNADPVPSRFDGGYYRSTDRYAPNNVYIKGDSVKADTEQVGLAPFTLKTGTPTLSGDAVPAFDVPEHKSSYAFDPVTGTYTKTEEGRPMNEALLAQPLRISMVVVLHAPRIVTGIIEDFNGARGLDWNLEAGGNAEIYYRGQKVSVHWNGSRTDPITFTLANGQELQLPNGLIWVDVVP